MLLVILNSCNDRQNPSTSLISDTTLVLNQALKDAVSARYMPDADALSRPYNFKDSILLTSKVSSLNLLQLSVSGKTFKVMGEKELVSTLTMDSSSHNLPNYLNISRFEKTDSGYYIQVQNLSPRPYGGGGSLGMYFVMAGDSTKIVKRLASSIN